MITSKNLLRSILFCTLMLSIIQCGSDPAEEGEKAFEAGNYNLAIKHFLEAKKTKPDLEQQYNEKVAISYMKRGQELYDRSKNVKTFSGNFEKAQEYVPAAPSTEFKSEYSKILFSLANAYVSTRPENEIQKEEYLNNTIQYLEDAIYYDGDNSEANELLVKIKADNFQKMLNKGNDFYSKAQKTKNNDYYINAEYYFQRAANFDIYNNEASSMLSKTRVKTLSILNNREDFAIAIGDMNQQPADLILDLTIKNYSTSPVTVDLQKFSIVDKEGNSYPVDQKMMNERFKNKKLQSQELAELKMINGFIVFSVPKRAKIEYLGYQLAENEQVKKYFP